MNTWIDLVLKLEKLLIGFYKRSGATVFILITDIRIIIRSSGLSREKKQMALDSFIGGLETIVDRLRKINIEDL